jgi:hypothetical protein
MQDDHAMLSGALVQEFRSPLLPAVSSEVAEAIAVHDAGWARIEQDAGGPVIAIAADGRPASFLDTMPAGFVAAWKGSIEHAAALSPLGGLIVSHHFSRLCKHRLEVEADSPQDTKLLRGFLEDESSRQKRLLAPAGVIEGAHGSQLEGLVDLLQFCDLLSLYLCSGATESAEFPQKFRGKTIRIARSAEEYILEPTLFGHRETLAKPGARKQFSVTATRFPASGEDEKPKTLSFTVR